MDFKTKNYSFRAKVWIYEGPGGWHFITLPKKLAAEIRLFHGQKAKNWGSIAVITTVGKTIWKTSIFRDTKSESYVLPLKAEIRKKEKIAVGKMLPVRIEI